MSSFHVEPFFDRATFTLTFVVADLATKDAVVIDPVLDYDPQRPHRITTAVDRRSARTSAPRPAAPLRPRDPRPRRSPVGVAAVDAGASRPGRDRRRIREVQETFKGAVRSRRSDFATDGSQFDRLLVDGETLAPARSRST
jgi:hypothetical protein